MRLNYDVNLNSSYSNQWFSGIFMGVFLKLFSNEQEIFSYSVFLGCLMK